MDKVMVTLFLIVVVAGIALALLGQRLGSLLSMALFGAP